MKRWKMVLLTAAVSSTFLLGGCGTAMYELTDDEQDIIAHYAAHALAKYNVYQKDGMTDASLDDPKRINGQMIRKKQKRRRTSRQQKHRQQSRILIVRVKHRIPVIHRSMQLVWQMQSVMAMI